MPRFVDRGKSKKKLNISLVSRSVVSVVYGYHIRLTRGRSQVRALPETTFFVMFLYRAIFELHCFRKLIINEKTLNNPLEDTCLIPDFSSKNGKKDLDQTLLLYEKDVQFFYFELVL